MAELSVPLLNRIVDRMFQHADPKADQNIWDLGRAAEEVLKEVQAERFFQTGDPAELGGYQPSPDQASRPVGPLGVGWRRGDGGRVQMSPVPLTFGGPPQPPPAPDYAAALGEVERRLMLKAPQYTGTTADKVDALAQDFQAADQQIRQQNKGIEQLKRELREKDEVVHELLEKVRTALDPGGQVENENLVVLARERMNQHAARKQKLDQLKERIGTEIEANSAEMLRRVLGARENETLGQAAKRVTDTAPVGWKRYQELEKDAREFEKEIRKLVRAQPEVDSDDYYYCPEQPTLDAVKRVIQRLMASESRIDGSLTQERVLDEIQQGWHDDNHGELQL